MRVKICGSAAWFLIAMASAASAQPLTGGKQIHVNLKAVTTPVKSTFRTPLYLATEPGLTLKRIAVHVSYPKGMLTFSSVEKGALIRDDRFEADAASVVDAKDATRETLKVEVRANSAAGDAVLPSGLLVYLDFAVTENAKPGLVTMENEVVDAEASDKRQLSKGSWVAENETLTIVGTDMVPILACFFYMH
jgi:hypothetical protein